VIIIKTYENLENLVGKEVPDISFKKLTNVFCIPKKYCRLSDNHSTGKTGEYSNPCLCNTNKDYNKGADLSNYNRNSKIKYFSEKLNNSEIVMKAVNIIRQDGAAGLRIKCLVPVKKSDVEIIESILTDNPDLARAEIPARTVLDFRNIKVPVVKFPAETSDEFINGLIAEYDSAGADKQLKIPLIYSRNLWN